MKQKKLNNNQETEVVRTTKVINSHFNPSIKMLIESFYTTANGQNFEFGLRLSRHSIVRSQHRGISPDDIALATSYGEEIHKQGLTFYHVKKKNLPLWMEKQTVERINNIVLVMDRSATTVITCYKSKGASMHLKRKPKTLMSYANDIN